MTGEFKLKAEAMKKWLEDTGTTQKKFCEETRIDEGNFSSYLNGKKEISPKAMKKILLRTGMSLEALFYFDRNA